MGKLWNLLFFLLLLYQQISVSTVILLQLDDIFKVAMATYNCSDAYTKANAIKGQKTPLKGCFQPTIRVWPCK